MMEHLRAQAAAWRTRAQTEMDAVRRDELLSLANFYEALAGELSAAQVEAAS